MAWAEEVDLYLQLVFAQHFSDSLLCLVEKRWTIKQLPALTKSLKKQTIKQLQAKFQIQPFHLLPRGPKKDIVKCILDMTHRIYVNRKMVEAESKWKEYVFILAIDYIKDCKASLKELNIPCVLVSMIMDYANVFDSAIKVSIDLLKDCGITFKG